MFYYILELNYSQFAVRRNTIMKKTMKIGRRSLAIVLSILMVFSALVFSVGAADPEPGEHVHHYDIVEVTIEPTCYEDGLRTYTCSTCDDGVEGHSYTEPISAGHNLQFSYHTDPTCSQQGYDTYVCSRCQVAVRKNFENPLGHRYSEEIIPVNCTEDGGILYTCTVCDESEPGHSYFESTETALDHDMGEYRIVTYGDAYAKLAECQREGCDYTAYELGEDESVNIYYRVQYVNDYVTNATDVASDGTTLSVAPFRSEFVGNEYVLAGTPAPEYSGETPTRDATYDYGAYEFAGWTTNDGNVDCVESNMILHAKFNGVDVQHWVVFENPNGARINTEDQWVNHGESGVYPAEDPTYSRTGFYNYVFNHWDTDLDTVYSNRAVKAIYDEVGKEYKIIYCDYNGSQLASEVFNYGQAPTANPTDLERPNDETFYYAFSGKWIYRYDAPSGETYETFSEFYDVSNKLVCPNNPAPFCLDCGRGYDSFEYDPANENDPYMTDIEKGIIRVFADYYTRPKIYRVRVVAVDSDGDPIRNAGTIQVLGSEGHLYKTATLDDDASAVLELTYDKFYTIQVSYSGEVAQQTITLDERNMSENFPTVRLVLGSPSAIQEDHAETCSCICHTPLIGRIYIAFLNVIYRLTGRKIVCCFDMYETHKDQLVYTA